MPSIDCGIRFDRLKRFFAQTGVWRAEHNANVAVLWVPHRRRQHPRLVDLGETERQNTKERGLAGP